MNSFRFPLSIPGEVTLDNQGWAVSAERRIGGPAGGPRAGRAEVAVAADPRLPLAVRSRRHGDRFRPLGHRAGRSCRIFSWIAKFLEKPGIRCRWSVDGADRIVWVVGEAVAEDFRVTEPSRGVILLKARRLGGLG